MPTWIIEPRDPLVVRDGRPFGPNPGARAESLPFPYPSTTTGALRTRAGQDADGVFVADPQEVLRIAVRGPLLVETGEDGEIAAWLLPPPTDALLLESEPPRTGHARRRRLVPLQVASEVVTNLPESLILVGPRRHEPAKPLKEAPRYWYWTALERWLTEAPGEDEPELASLGHNGPTHEQRLHVSIQSETRAAAQGALFATSGLEFMRVDDRERSVGSARPLALALVSEAASLATGPGTLGGEGRIVTWRRSALTLPDCPAVIRDTVMAQGCCRLVLLTPAYFVRGWRPSWLLEQRLGVTPHLVGAAVGRPQVVSGWDFAFGNPKPTRRLAPAGSVLFLCLEGQRDAIGAWVDALWMQCVSDDERSRIDGFGLAALGTWDGTLQTQTQAMEESA